MSSSPSQGQQSQNAGRSKSTRRFLSKVVLQSHRRWRQVSAVVFNLALYGVLVIAYFLLVLQWLNEPLARLFQQDLNRYAIVSVLLILGQGLLLDVIASSLHRLVIWMNQKWRE